MSQLIVDSFHILKREYARAQLWAGILTSEDARRCSISSSRFLCSSICFNCYFRKLLANLSDWAAAAAAPASAMASCFFSLISRARSASRSISAQWGARRWQRQDRWFEEKVETGSRRFRRSRRFRTTDWSFSVSLQCFCILFCMRSALATAWQHRAWPLANPDNNR